MGQGIQDFYNAARTYGFSRDYQLRVAQIGNIFPAPFGDMYVYAKTANIPKRSLNSTTLNIRGFMYNVPMQVQYDSGSWALTIYCDQSYIIRGQIEAWQKSIFDEHTMQGSMENKVIQLNLLNDNTDTVAIYQLHGAYPQSIGDIQYDLSGNGKPQSFEITFAYQYWTSRQVSIRQTENMDLLSRITGGLRNLNTLGQGINNTIKNISNLGSFF